MLSQNDSYEALIVCEMVLKYVSGIFVLYWVIFNMLYCPAFLDSVTGTLGINLHLRAS